LIGTAEHRCADRGTHLSFDRREHESPSWGDNAPKPKAAEFA
jgi:hypothetical protein